jgi:hypothetical protein
MGRPRKPLWRFASPWVRIPYLPPPNPGLGRDSSRQGISPELSFAAFLSFLDLRFSLAVLAAGVFALRPPLSLPAMLASLRSAQRRADPTLPHVATDQAGRLLRGTPMSNRSRPRPAGEEGPRRVPGPRQRTRWLRRRGRTRGRHRCSRPRTMPTRDHPTSELSAAHGAPPITRDRALRAPRREGGNAGTARCLRAASRGVRGKSPTPLRT